MVKGRRERLRNYETWKRREVSEDYTTSRDEEEVT